MFRLLIRSLAINFASVYIAISVLAGIVTYSGGFRTLLLAAIAIALVNLLVRPIINLLLLPIHLITLGLFRWIANLLVLYIVTLLIPNLQINPFTSPQISLSFLIIPSINFSVFGAFIFVTAVFTLIFHFLYWLFQD